ncbi:hypothetical protein D3C76_1172810 [compost metagenome]
MPGLANEGSGKQTTTAVGAVQQVAPAIGLARLQGPGPGIVTHAVHLFRPLPAPGFRQPLWITLIEQRHALRGERMMRGMDIHRQLRSTVTGFQQAHQRRDAPYQKGHQPPHGTVMRTVLVQIVCQFRTMIGPRHRGHRGDQVRAFGCCVAGGQRALAVANQVDLPGTGLAQNLLDPRQQLLTAHIIGVERRNLHRKHHRTTTAQCLGDPVPVRIKHQPDEPEHSRDQHQWVTRGRTLRHGRNILVIGEVMHGGCKTSAKLRQRT